MTNPVVRLFYVDDSGAEAHGWAVYSWVECTVPGWRHALRAWLDLRHRLHAEHGIPANYELHASKFVGGRGNPSLDERWNRQKRNRTRVMEDALATLGECPELHLGSLYRRTPARRHDYGATMAELYAELVQHLDVRLAAQGDFGLIVVDGNGTDHRYRGPHRDLKLDRRHLLEDPFFQDSYRSQWVQMADLTAYTAYLSLARPPRKDFGWQWYDRFLRASDVNGGPVEL